MWWPGRLYEEQVITTFVAAPGHGRVYRWPVVRRRPERGVGAGAGSNIASAGGVVSAVLALAGVRLA
jgi:hypothetical protein